MYPLLIIISGHPATGKTSLAKKLAKELNLPLFSKDKVKETLFDRLGWDSADLRAKLEETSTALLHEAIISCLETSSGIIAENNFVPSKENEFFKDLSKRLRPKIFQVHCFGTPEVIYQRFIKRKGSPKRHPGHVDDYTFEHIKEAVKTNYFGAVNIHGETIELNTDDFKNVDISKIVERIKRALES